MIVTSFKSSSEEQEPVVISWPSNIFLKLLVASLFNHTPVRGERLLKISITPRKNDPKETKFNFVTFLIYLWGTPIPWSKDSLNMGPSKYQQNEYPAFLSS